MDTNAPFLITIGRHYGSQGRSIGEAIAAYFGIAYYDKVVLSQAAEDTGLGPRVFHHPQPPTHDRKGLLRQVIGAVQPFIGGGDFYSNAQLSEENIFSLQSGVIRKLANEHSCLFVGRAADYILRDHPRRINIFVTANLEDRIQHVMQQKNLDHKAASKRIKQIDDQRASYYNFYADSTWAAAETYDLCVNVSALGIERSKQFIIDFISSKLHIELPVKSANEAPEIF